MASNKPYEIVSATPKSWLNASNILVEGQLITFQYGDNLIGQMSFTNQEIESGAARARIIEFINKSKEML